MIPKSATERTRKRRTRITGMLDLLEINSESTLLTRMLAAMESNPVALILVYKKFSKEIDSILK